MTVTPRDIAEWRARGHPYLLIAAEMAEWAKDKPYGTRLPDDAEFTVAATPSTYSRAKAFLVTNGVLAVGDGPHFVT